MIKSLKDLLISLVGLQIHWFMMVEFASGSLVKNFKSKKSKELEKNCEIG